MGHTLRKVEPGDPLAIPAAAYNTFVDPGKAIVKKPVAAYVEKVCQEGNFSVIGSI